MKLSSRQWWLVIGFCFLLAILSGRFFLLPRGYPTVMEFPEWARIKSDADVLARWQDAQTENSAIPVVLYNEEVVARLVQDYPTAYYVDTRSTRNFNAGSRVVVMWVIMINDQFVIYEMRPKFYDVILRGVNPHIEGYTLYFETETDWFGWVFSFFLTCASTFFGGLILVLILSIYNEIREKEQQKIKVVETS
jgi:hypothetical protein